MSAKRLNSMAFPAVGFVSPTPVPYLCTKRFARRTHITLVAKDSAGLESTKNYSCQVSRRSLLLCGMVAASQLLPSIRDVSAQSSEKTFFTLPDLPYAYDALEPRISQQIMRAHHDAHFATYVKNLNTALNAVPDRLRPAPSDDAGLRRLLSRLRDIQDGSVQTMVRNNGGGYLNHKQFFSQMSPKPEGGPDDELTAQINKDFGSFETFKEQFLKTATGLFGSGFVWLVKNRATGKLSIKKYANQDNPVMDEDDGIPLLGCDCWEHAWYYQYGPKKADYIKAWWELVNWRSVSELYAAH